ncbi:MAG: fatty acid desaturase [Planctomycetota bacterium]|jgi:fatty acid desaturase
MRNNLFGVLGVLLPVISIFIGLSLMSISYWLLPLAVVIFSYAQYQAFCVAHFAGHQTLFGIKIANNLVVNLVHILLGLRRGYLKVHWQHHRCVKNPVSDPTEHDLHAYGLRGQRSTGVWLFIINPCRLLFTSIPYRGIEWYWIPSVIVLGVVSWCMEFDTVFIFLATWVFARLIALWWIVYVTNILYHYLVPVESGGETRNIDTWLLGFPMLFDGLHARHHHKPSVPWWEIPKMPADVLYDLKQVVQQVTL